MLKLTKLMLGLPTAMNFNFKINIYIGGSIEILTLILGRRIMKVWQLVCFAGPMFKWMVGG